MRIINHKKINRKCDAFTALLIVELICRLPLESAQAARKNQDKQEPVSASAIQTETQTSDLLLTCEEEKLARDVYVLLSEKWSMRIFKNISRAEQQHMNAMRKLLDKYNLTDPSREPHQFSNAALQNQFNELISDGESSKEEALCVGARIEEVDINDFLAAIQQTDQADIISMYLNLLKGSKIHLNSFVRKIESATGQPYTAKLMTQKDVDDIRRH